MIFQMVNRDTGSVVYEADVPTERQFKMDYLKWALNNQQKTLLPDQQEIQRGKAPLILSDEELRLLGKALLARSGYYLTKQPVLEKLYRKIKQHLEK